LLDVTSPVRAPELQVIPIGDVEFFKMYARTLKPEKSASVKIGADSDQGHRLIIASVQPYARVRQIELNEPQMRTNTMLIQPLT